MRTLRRILFYVFLVLYLVAAPLTILYSLGYIVRPGHEHGFVKSGLIALGTTPPGGRVFVGHSRYSRRTPTVIRDLLPGAYNVRITLPGHQAWNGVVRVEAEKATRLDELILLPQDLAPVVLDEGPFVDLIPAPLPDLLLLNRGDRLDEQLVYDADDEQLRPLLSTNPVGPSALLRRSHRVDESPRTLLEVEAEGRTHYLWCRLDKREEAEDISALLPEPPDAVTWDRRSDDELFARHGTGVSRLDLDDRAIYPGILSHVLSLGVYRDHLYALDQSNRFFRANREGRNSERVGKAPSEVRTFWGSRTGYALHFVDDELVLFEGDEGELYANQEPHLLVERNAHGLQPHPRDRRLLVWDRRRLGWIDLTRETGIRELTPRVSWLYENAQPIQHAAWVHDGTHIVYSAGGQLYLLALEPGGGPPARALAPCHDHLPFVFSERSGRLYYLDAARRLNALRILPGRDLLPRAAARDGRKEAAP